MRATRRLTVAAVLGAAGATVHGASYDPPVSVDLNFIFHIDEDIAEQDVFVERVPGSDEVFRPTKGDRDMSLPLYAAAAAVQHAPFDSEAVGPWKKGAPLGVTLGEWFQGRGNGTYSCADGEGRIRVEFTGLIPEGVYTLWHFFMAMPPTDPFIDTYDLPVGSRDGSQSVFRTDSSGAALYERTFRPCLQMTGEHLASGLAIAWHSDGKTYGPLPGEFTTTSHVQMYLGLPKRTGL